MKRWSEAEWAQYSEAATRSPVSSARTMSARASWSRNEARKASSLVAPSFTGARLPVHQRRDRIGRRPGMPLAALAEFLSDSSIIYRMTSPGAALLREARLRRGLTQRELADLVGVPQPTISAIESGRRSPRLDFVDRIIRRGRLPLELQLTEDPPFSAAATGREMRRRLNDPERDRAGQEDGALRAVIDLRDALLRASSEGLLGLVYDRPILCGEHRWDAFVAGVVEEVCSERRQAPPPWTQEPERFVRPFWHLSSLSAFHQWELETAPAALLRHGVLAAAGELASA